MVETNQRESKDGNSQYRIEVSQEQLDQYLISPISKGEEKSRLDEFEFEKNLTKQYKKALVIARMQPLHFGHLLTMKMALRAAKSLVIVIGSSNIRDWDNPWTVEEREAMLRKALEINTDIKGGLSDVVHLPDFFNNKGEYDDPKWVEETLQRVGDADVGISSNDWVKDLLREKMDIITPPLFNRDHFQGKIIRQYLRRKKSL